MTNIEDLAYRFRWQIAFILVGISLAAGGVFLALNPQTSKVEIITNETTDSTSNLRVEVSGGVKNPGVYELAPGSRIEDALGAAGNLSESANTEWIDKYLNRAAFVTDGQKIYIPTEDEQTNSATANNPLGDESVSEVLASQIGSQVNINTASQSELESLNGIGPVYAQKIIENRPYSTIDELSSKSIIPKSTYEKIKENISVY